MGFAASMLDEDGLRVTDDGFELDIHPNWYRSLPLSSVTTVDLTVNGERIAKEEIAFSVNGAEHGLEELAERYDETWFVLDPATLRVRRQLVRRDESVDVWVRLRNRIPYLLIGPDRPLESVTEAARTLVAS